jgi:hypothetical protein
MQALETTLVTSVQAVHLVRDSHSVHLIGSHTRWELFGTLTLLKVGFLIIAYWA